MNLRKYLDDNPVTAATIKKCLRKGVPCTYSSCLPKGRPSLYRTSEGSTGSKSPPKAAAAPSMPPETVPVTSTSEAAQPVLPIAFSRTDQQHRDITSVSHANADADETAHVGRNAHGDASVFPAFADDLTDFWASWLPQDHHIADGTLGTNSACTLNLDPALEAHPLASLGFSGSFPRAPDGSSSTVNDGSAGHGHTGGNDDAEDSSTSGSSSRRAATSDKGDCELNISHLSQLSTRLSQLLGSSRSFLAETVDTSRQSKNHHDPALQAQLGIEAVFKSINTWLLRGSGNSDPCPSLHMGPSNAFDLPHRVFSASNHLLEILCHSGSHAEATATRPPRDTNRHSSSVVHDLVHACVTLLLNMYIAILTALQRSADALSSSPRPDPVEPNDHMDAVSRGHLQLVSVVQLCSYFIQRHDQNLDLILSSSQGPLHAPPSRESVHRQSASFDTTSALRTEVKQRLRRLQESLSCSPLI